jgi:hypothetical protein
VQPDCPRRPNSSLVVPFLNHTLKNFGFGPAGFEFLLDLTLSSTKRCVADRSAEFLQSLNWPNGSVSQRVRTVHRTWIQSTIEGRAKSESDVRASTGSHAARSALKA